MNEPWLVAIYGPTGSGKTWLAEGIAERFGAQLVNADAFQVYRGLDVGTAKPINKSRYQLLDLVDPEEDFSVVQWVREAETALNDAWSRGQCVVLVGGTGFYMRALLERYAELGTAPDPVLRADLMREEQDLGLGHLVSRLQGIDPEAAGRIDLKNPVRVRRALERA